MLGFWCGDSRGLSSGGGGGTFFLPRTQLLQLVAIETTRIYFDLFGLAIVNYISIDSTIQCWIREGLAA